MNVPVLGEVPNRILDKSEISIFAKIQDEYFTIENGNKIILLTASSNGAEKSITAINMAKSLAVGYNRVLLIDCDFKRPLISRLTNRPSKFGLSDVIEKGTSLGEAILIEEGSFDILSSGRNVTNPVDIFDSTELEKIIEFLKKIYDFIIIDIPSVEEYQEVKIMSAYFGDTILVVDEKKMKKKKLVSCKENIEENGGNLVGVIINRPDKKQIDLSGDVEDMWLKFE